MSWERMLEIACKNHKKAKIAYDIASKRKGVTETEIRNLLEKIEYTSLVMEIIKSKM